MLSHFYDEINNENGTCCSSTNEDDRKKFFEENSKQKNENLDEVVLNRTVKEINEDVMTGFSTPDCYKSDLMEPSYDKYFTVNVTSDETEYFEKLFKKSYILHVFFKLLQQRTGSKKEGFEVIEGFFADAENSTKDSSVMALETGLRVSFSMLSELKGLSKNILHNVLGGIYSSLLQTPQRSLYGTQFHDYVMDDLFNSIRAFLIELVEDPSISAETKELSLKIVLLLGSVRCSAEDLLIVQNLIRAHSFDFNFDQEISRFEFVDGKEEDGEKDRSFLTEFTYQAPGNIGESEINYSNKFTVAFDSDYLYVHQTGSGIKRVSKKEGQALNVGYVLEENTDLYSTNAEMMFFNGRLLFRKFDSDGIPFAIVDPDTLKEIEGEELESYKKKVEALKRTEETDRNAYILEWMSDDFDEDKKKPGRYLTDSPFITEGKNFYVVS